MECLEFRRLCGAEPYNEDPAFIEHVESCSRCGEYAREIRSFDVLVREALEIDTSSSALPDFIPGSVATERRVAERETSPWLQAPWLALAASLVLVFGLAAGIWVSTSSNTLARDVVAHIHHEPQALTDTDVSVASEDIYRVMDRAGYRFKDEVGLVTYTRTCIFRGYKVPHLVVQGEQGPITVMLLPDIDVVQPVEVDHDGFMGTIIPFDRGSLAVVGEPGENLNTMTAQLVNGIERSN